MSSDYLPRKYEDMLATQNNYRLFVFMELFCCHCLLQSPRLHRNIAQENIENGSVSWTIYFIQGGGDISLKDMKCKFALAYN